MANIQDKILSKYGIDIAQENILKLYKIESADITPEELEKVLLTTRQKWENSAQNGTNEKFKERDKTRLSKADKYEAILKDDKLRKSLFEYYQNGGADSSSSSSSVPWSSDDISFAREYFKLVETTKKLNRKDVEFYLEYYKPTKSRKAIVEMLEKEFKVKGLGKNEKNSEAVSDDDPEGETKDENSPLITNLFQEATVKKIHKCEGFYQAALQSENVCVKYPAIKDGLYDFLELKDCKNIEAFRGYIDNKKTEVFNVRQDKGTDFIPLVDLFNTLSELLVYKDVVDNFYEFTLLIKYPHLTPYMYAFVEMKTTTIKGILDIANRDYSFRDDTDFILNYYNPVHDNFGISNSGISSMINRAEKKAKSNRVLNELDEKFGRKKKRKVSIAADIVHFLVYWPIFAVYFLFEVFKAIFTELHKFTVPVFAALFIGESWILPKLTGLDNLLILRKVFFKNEWQSYLDKFIGVTGDNAFETIIISLILIIALSAIYIIPPLFIAIFVSETASNLNKMYDWVGFERTFQNIFQKLRANTENDFSAQKNLFLKKCIPKVLINIIGLAGIIIIVHFIPIGFHSFSEKTGYFQKQEVSEDRVDTADTDLPVEDTADGIIMIVTASEANIRSGPSTDYDVVATGSEGEIFIATGNEEIASNGRIWYEIYLDESRSETGWASEKVLSFY